MFQSLQRQFLLYRANSFLKLFQKHIIRNSAILDFGTGWGSFSHILKEQGHKVTSIDITNKSLHDDVTPIIYDGENLIFKDHNFDISLVITVLHHTPNPEDLLIEISRVSKKIIIVEDIYQTKLGEFTTKFFDSLTNLEFRSHPHSNKTDVEWKKLFKKLNLKLTKSIYFRKFIVFNLAVYVLEKRKNV